MKHYDSNKNISNGFYLLASLGLTILDFKTCGATNEKRELERSLIK